MAGIRDGVCYVGLVFKRFQGGAKREMACSAAQLFLQDGDGTIFRGNNGLWLSEKENEFHLDKVEAFKLINLALKDYKSKNGDFPKELFIHGRATFSDEEWAGFNDAVASHGADTNLVGIVIKDNAALKFFRNLHEGNAEYGVLRGIATIIDDNEAYLFTRGFVPRLGTSLSLETPNPLHIKITRGKAGSV